MPKLKKNSGFSLIEILISLLFIGALVTILLTTTGSLFTCRQSDLQSVAAKIATKEIERLRGLDFDPLINQGDWSLPNCDTTFYATELQSLRAGKVCRDLSDYNSLPNDPVIGTTQIVQVAITVYWENDNGVEKSLPMDTLISENGL